MCARRRLSATWPNAGRRPDGTRAGIRGNPVSDEDLHSLMPGVRDALGDPVNKADIYVAVTVIVPLLADLVALPVLVWALPTERSWEWLRNQDKSE